LRESPLCFRRVPYSSLSSVPTQRYSLKLSLPHFLFLSVVTPFYRPFFVHFGGPSLPDGGCSFPCTPYSVVAFVALKTFYTFFPPLVPLYPWCVKTILPPPRCQDHCSGLFFRTQSFSLGLPGISFRLTFPVDIPEDCRRFSWCSGSPYSPE